MDIRHVSRDMVCGKISKSDCNCGVGDGVSMGKFYMLILSYILNLIAHWEGKDLEVIGYVTSIPSIQERSVRFEFSVSHATLLGINENLIVPKKVRLNWYGKFPALHLGEKLET